MSRLRRLRQRRARQRARARLRAATWECVRWALATFPDETLEQQAIHLVKETRELEFCGTVRDDAEWEELADVFILASLIAHRTRALAGRHGLDLPAALRTKLAINRTRKWERTPDGDYQHVKGPTT